MDNFDYDKFYHFLRENVGNDYDDYYKKKICTENGIFRITLMKFDKRLESTDIINISLDELENRGLLNLSGGILGDFGGRAWYDIFYVYFKEVRDEKDDFDFEKAWDQFKKIVEKYEGCVHIGELRGVEKIFVDMGLLNCEAQTIGDYVLSVTEKGRNI